jgi:hypothetical protein
LVEYVLPKHDVEGSNPFARSGVPRLMDFRELGKSIADFLNQSGIPCELSDSPVPKALMAEHVVKCLNEYFQIDPEAIKALFAHRVPVNEALADHPTVQVTAGDPSTMSILGLLNGIVGTIPGTDSIGYVCGDYDDEDYDRLLGFSVHPKAEFEAKDASVDPVP